MKKIKLLGVLLLAVLLAPTLVNAAGDYKTYRNFEQVNFLTNETEYKASKEPGAKLEDFGTHTLVLKDEGSKAEYVKAMTLSMVGGTGTIVSKENSPLVAARNAISDLITRAGKSFVSPYVKDFNGANNTNVGLISIDDIKNVFNVKLEEGKDSYDLDLSNKDYMAVMFVLGTHVEDAYNKDKSSGTLNATPVLGLYTETTDETGVWVLEFATPDRDKEKIDKVTLRHVSYEELLDHYYFVAPTLYFGKQYDCHYDEKNACYKCPTGDEKNPFKFVWTKEGTQDSSCELTTYTDQSKCYKNPETGVVDYALEIIGVVAVCACGLVILKKKDFFRA